MVWGSVAPGRTAFGAEPPEHEVNKHLAEALVALRRQHANDALSASTERLKTVASSFLDNLKSLSSQSVGACYGFISQGENSPAVLDVLQSPEQGAAVQAQIAAIFEAIADGRKTPATHDKAAKADYDVLVQELTKLGWKENDLQVFSNPTLLAKDRRGASARWCRTGSSRTFGDRPGTQERCWSRP